MQLPIAQYQSGEIVEDILKSKSLHHPILEQKRPKWRHLPPMTAKPKLTNRLQIVNEMSTGKNPWICGMTVAAVVRVHPRRGLAGLLNEDPM